MHAVTCQVRNKQATAVPGDLRHFYRLIHLIATVITD